MRGQGVIIVQIRFLRGLGFFRLCKGDLQIESTAFAYHTFHPYAAAMIGRNGMDNGKPQAGAGLGARFALFAAIEFLEQTRQIIRCNANAGIFHRKDQITGL